MKTIEEFVAYVNKHKSSDDVLDEEVHDHKALEASEINNAGLEGQLDYLLDCMGPEALENLLRLMFDDET